MNDDLEVNEELALWQRRWGVPADRLPRLVEHLDGAPEPSGRRAGSPEGSTAAGVDLPAEALDELADIRSGMVAAVLQGGGEETLG